MKSPLRLAIVAVGALSLPAFSADRSTRMDNVAREGIDSLEELRNFQQALRGLPAGERAAYLAAVRLDPRIFGGEAVEIEDHPWQVALVRGYMTARSQFCGGTLVAPDVVVTAAHCIDSRVVLKNPARVDVVSGTTVFPEGGERLKTTSVFIHPLWDRSSWDYDIAIIKLASPVRLGRPIPVDEQVVDVGTRAWVTGWGALTEGGQNSPDLMGVEVPVVGTDLCNSADSYNGDITAQMMCAGYQDGGRDSCQGDSGGPLVAGTGPGARLIGVVSWGDGCARRLKYGVYTRISSVTPWIRSFLGP